MPPRRSGMHNNLQKNGYPSKFISYTQTNRNLPITSQNTPTIKYISGPYVKGAPEKIGKLLLKHGTKLASNSRNTLRRNLCKLKEKPMKIQELSMKSNVWIVCSASYVGETGRELQLRIKEHQENNATIKGHSNRKHSRLFWKPTLPLTNENSIYRHIDISEVYRAAINNIIH